MPACLTFIPNVKHGAGAEMRFGTMMRFALVALVFALLGATASADDLGTLAEKVTVGTIPEPIPLAKARASLWDCFPTNSGDVFDKLPVLGWRGEFDAFSSAMVGKAKEKRLEADALERGLKKILAQEGEEGHVVVPVAAYRARIGTQEVWIIHLYWEDAPRYTVIRTKEGPKLGVEGFDSLTHVRTYAWDLATDAIVAFKTCL